MPNSYMLDVWVLISDVLDCMLQSVREALLVGFEIGPASVELVFAMGILICLVKLSDYPHFLQKPTRDCQLSSMIRFVTATYKPEYKNDWGSDLLLILFCLRICNASYILSSFKSWPNAFQVQ